MIGSAQYQLYRTAVKVAPEGEGQYLLYEAFSRIHRKLRSVNFKPNLLLYVFVEELRLLFDAPVVRVSYRGRAETNILTAEYLIISQVLDAAHLIETAFANYSVAANKLGSTVGRTVNNSNLENIDSLIVLPVLDGQNEAQGSIEIYFSSKHPESMQAFTSIFSDLASPTGTHVLKLLTQTLCSTNPRSASGDDDDAFLQGPGVLDIKERFRRECHSLPPERFIEKYKKFFLPFDAVVSILKAKLDSRLSNGIEPYSIIFSYRMPKDKDDKGKVITFFLTSDQVATFLEEASDKEKTIDNLVSFGAFQYRESQALSGYLLKTGYSDYTANFSEDPRWTEWINSITGEEKEKVTRQLDLVKNFFGENMNNAFLLPVYSLFDSKSEESELLVMVSITSEKPIDKWMRRRIFDLVWQSRVAIELSVALQKVSQELIDLEKLSIVAAINASVGHELRQPLQVISTNMIYLYGYLEQIKNKVETSIALEKITGADGIEASLKEITQTLDQLIDVDKIANESIIINRALCDMNTLIEATAQSYPLKIVTRLSPDLPLALVDEEQLEKVLRNLLNNAKDATEELPNQRKIAVCSRLKGGYIEIEISDNGCGIPQDVLEKLTKVLVTYNKKRGTGLGLYIVNGMIKAHDGEMSIRSEIGRGTTVMFTIPCAPQAH